MGSYKRLTKDGVKNTCGRKTGAVGRTISEVAQGTSDPPLAFHCIIH
jgi:hypothetical protein